MLIVKLQEHLPYSIKSSFSEVFYSVLSCMLPNSFYNLFLRSYLNLHQQFFGTNNKLLMQIGQICALYKSSLTSPGRDIIINELLNVVIFRFMISIDFSTFGKTTFLLHLSVCSSVHKETGLGHFNHFNSSKIQNRQFSSLQ